jgi:hypothetical protein
MVVLALATGFTLYFFNPGLWVEVGGDSKVFYTAANLAAQGGNPYDPAAIGHEADVLLNIPAHAHYPEPNYLGPASYAYPPLYTRALELGRGLPWLAFYLLGAALMLACAVAALEVLMRALRWRDRGIGRLGLLISTPLATTIFDWNPSALAMLILAAGFALMARRRMLLAGLVLSLSTFKLAQALPVAVALLVAGIPDPTAWPPAAGARQLLLGAGRTRLTGLAGFAAGCLGLLGLNAAVARPGELSAWLGGMTSLGGQFASQGNGSRSAFAQTLLAGLPALVMERTGTAIATALAVVLVAGLLAWVALSHRNLTENLRREPLLLAALLVSAAMAALPYTHTNDLLLDALPLLVACSLPGRPWALLAPLVWYAGPLLRFLQALAFGLLFGISPNAKAGWGVAMSGALLLVLAAAAALPPRYPAAAPPVADQRR